MDSYTLDFPKEDRLLPVTPVVELCFNPKSITTPISLRDRFSSRDQRPYEYDRQRSFGADAGSIQEIRDAEPDSSHGAADTRKSRLLAAAKQYDSGSGRDSDSGSGSMSALAGGYSSVFVL